MNTVPTNKIETGRGDAEPRNTPTSETAKPNIPDTPEHGLAKFSPIGNAHSATGGTLSPIVKGQELRKKELLELVTARSGLKRKDVKPVVEAMLAVLGEALSEQREMQIKPLGKIKIQRAKEIKNGRMIILKLRQNNAAPAGSLDGMN